MTAFLNRYYAPLLIGILAFSFVTRVYRLHLPETYMFDEVYHALTAKLIARNDPQAFEWWNPPVEENTAVDWLHPPLAKYTQALSMKLLGKTSFAWRLSSVVFGVGVIFLTATLARALFESKEISLLAALLASLDGLLLALSRIAMNDIHVTFFILLTLLWYVYYLKSYQFKWLALTGLAAGLAMGSKWSGLFVLVTVSSYEGWRILQHLFVDLIQKKVKSDWKSTFFKQVITRLAVLILLPVTIYVFSYTGMFLQGKSLVCLNDEIAQGQCSCSQTSSWWVTGLSTLVPQQTKYWESLEARAGCKRLISHFSELHNQIWWYQTTLTATHGYQSRPWQWFLDLRPVWFYVDYLDEARIANIYAQGNPLLFWVGDLAVIYSIVFLVRHKWKRVSTAVAKNTLIVKTKALALKPEYQYVPLLVMAYLMVWLPWQISPRIMFFYHYTPAVPLLCIILSFWLGKLARTRWGSVVPVTLAAIFLTFVIFYPNWVGLSVPKKWADNVYFVTERWR